MGPPTPPELTAPVDVLVIGAGPAGSASAALLRRSGFTVRIVEQTHFPRFVIGESLLPHCMDVLDEAGLLEAAKARNFMVKNGALFVRGAERCSFAFAEQFTRGWSWTWQVPRAEFDQTLVEAVAAQGASVHFGTSVVAASFDGAPRITVTDESGVRHELSPRWVVDASGYGRVLPRLLGLDEPSQLPPRVALFAHVTNDRRPPGPDEGRIWICVHPDGGWLWVIPFADGRTSVGAVASPEFFDRFTDQSLEERLRAIVATEPNAAARLQDAKYLFEPRILKNYACAVKALHGPGYCLVGNATEFLDPIFSSGVTLGLESASLAARLVAKELRGEPADWAEGYVAPMKRGVDVFRTFVTRWYDGMLIDLIFAASPTKEVSAQICSVLAGYVWDLDNPVVRHHARRIAQLARFGLQPPPSTG